MKFIDNNLGSSFPPPAKYGGGVFMLFGFMGLFGNLIIGVIVILIGGYLCFTYNGIQINIDDKKFREYTSYYGIKQGKWQSLKPYINISVLRRKESYSSVSRGSVSRTDSEWYYDVCLLTANHRNKLMVKRVSEKEKAIEVAKELSHKLDVTLTKYNPQVSTTSKSRR